MKKSIKTTLIAVFILFPAYLTTAAPATAADGIAQRTQQDKDGFITMVCADFNMLTRQGQSYCLQELYGQSLEFAKRFFAAMDITPANKMQRIREWRDKVGLNSTTELSDDEKTKAQTAVTYLLGYGPTCQQLSDTIMNPGQLLGMEGITIDTLVGLPEYCVEQAIVIARTFGLSIDFNEARHLTESINKVRGYYEARPNIPEPRAGEKIKLPTPV